MNFSVDKQIDSLNNPEYKFLVSLKKNRNRKSNKKSLAEGFRECYQLIESRYEIDTLYYCCLLYTSPSPRDLSTSRMPSSA